MQPNQPSASALISAFGRAYHSAHGDPKIFDDYLADKFFTTAQRTFFTENLSRAYAFFEPQAAAEITDPAQALAGFMRAQSLSITLSRARYVETILDAAIQNGVKQFLILGAGLDTFAFRRADLLERLDVYEVDHPNTQNYKRQRITELGWEVPARLHLIPLDLNQDDLSTALLGAGWNVGERALISWLGVTYYLAREVIHSTVRALAQVVPANSILIFDYLDADAFIPERTAPRVARMQLATQMAGEPMVTGFDPQKLVVEFAPLGFELAENLGPADIQQRYFQNRSDGYYAFEHIHLAKLVR